MIVIDASSVARSTASVAFDRATHLYRSVVVESLTVPTIQAT
jgi:hypothetical protein